MAARPPRVRDAGNSDPIETPRQAQAAALEEARASEPAEAGETGCAVRARIRIRYLHSDCFRLLIFGAKRMRTCGAEKDIARGARLSAGLTSRYCELILIGNTYARRLPIRRRWG